MFDSVKEYYYVAVNGEKCVFNRPNMRERAVSRDVHEKLWDAHMTDKVDGVCLTSDAHPWFNTKYNTIPVHGRAVRVGQTTMNFNTDCNCAICQADVSVIDRASCAKMLAAGKCADVRMRRVLGTVLYPALYAQNVK